MIVPFWSMKCSSLLKLFCLLLFALNFYGCSGLYHQTNRPGLFGKSPEIELTGIEGKWSGIRQDYPIESFQYYEFSQDDEGWKLLLNNKEMHTESFSRVNDLTFVIRYVDQQGMPNSILAQFKSYEKSVLNLFHLTEISTEAQDIRAVSLKKDFNKHQLDQVVVATRLKGTLNKIDY